MKVTRRRAGYQQQHVARLLVNVNVSTLSLWENEQYMPSGASLVKLCVLYGKTLKELYPEYFQLVEKDLAERQEHPDGDAGDNSI